MKKTRTINTLRSESLFEQPICIDGVSVGVIKYDEKDFWDLTGIFDGDPNWVPKSFIY